MTSTLLKISENGTSQRFFTFWAIGLLTLLSLANLGGSAIGQEPTIAIEPPLVSVLPSDDSLISNSVFGNSFETDPFAQSSIAQPSIAQPAIGQMLEPAIGYENFSPVPMANIVDEFANPKRLSQRIQLRKNVLGCQKCYRVRPEDEIWVVSVRDCDFEKGDLARIKVKRLVDGALQESTLDSLSSAHLSDLSRTSLVYVHGNQTNYEYAIARGFQLYNNLFVETDCLRPPVRLVLWVWKSEREKPRLYTDYLIKSTRAAQLGTSLTRTLESFGNRKVAIVGFSLGAQVILSSLEEMEPQCACEVTGEKYHVALIAPATDPTYVCNVIDRNVETSIVRKTFIVENKNDRAVRAMRVVLRRECPEARQIFSELALQHHYPLAGVQLLEVSRELSCKHAIDRYTKAPSVRRAVAELLSDVANGH